MASTYSQNLKIELLGTGDQAGTWGDTTNTNLGTALEQAIVGRGVATFAADADLTLTLTNSNASQVARSYALHVVSSVSLTATRNLVVPTITKPYLVLNATTGGQSIVVKTAAGTGVTIPNGKEVLVYVDGANVVAAFDYAPSLSLGAALPVSSGGTGATDAAGARANLGIVAPPDVSNLVQRTGDSMTGALNEAVMLTLASAATTDIGAQNSNTLSITGSTTITSLGTATAGVIRRLVFANSLTLTHNATSLILPGGASITTAAGDVAQMLSLGAGNWRCVQYEKASGGAIAPGVPDGVFLFENVYTATSSLVVPAGVSKLRGYAVGAGAAGTTTASGGGGGMAFGTIAVTPGETITIDITTGVAKVLRGATVLLQGNPASGVTAGTATKDASVTAGGNFSGGAGTAGASSGGASAGSPLGNGFPGGSDQGGGGGIGGAGGNGANGAGGGGGGAGGTGAAGGLGGTTTAAAGGGAGGPAQYGTAGPGRTIPFTDRLLRRCLGAGGMPGATGIAGGSGMDGGGGGGGSGIAVGGAGGFGGGGGSSGGGGIFGGPGGALGGGGGCSVTASAAVGGAGGFGGGGGSTSLSAAGGGAGGPAAVWIYY